MAAFPKNTNYRQGLADTLTFQAGLVEAENRLDEAEALYRRALKIQEEILSETPNVQLSLISRAGLLGDLGSLYVEAGTGGRGPAAPGELPGRDARTTLKLVPNSPTILKYTRMYADRLTDLLLDTRLWPKR